MAAGRAPLLAAIGLACATWSCLQPNVAPAPPKWVESERHIVFYSHPLEVHLCKPTAPIADKPLLLFATGDGGWRGVAVDVYHEMAGWGYPVAGFSAKDYLKHLGFVSGTTTPRRLALDYRRLIAFAKGALGMPAGAATILVGISRGAGLAVVAASRAEVQPELAGVVAVALTKEEEYVRRYKVKPGKTPADMPSRELVTFETYDSLGELRSLPLVVIQSTHDSYLDAGAARELFGPDTDTRKLFAIDARNHNFSGGRDALYQRMASSLAWISGTPAGARSPTVESNR